MFKALPAAICLTLSANSALACTPDPAFAYDTLQDDITILATATVDTVTLQQVADKICWQVSYSGAAYIKGDGDGAFSAALCADEVLDQEAIAEQTEGLQYLGMVPGAEVLVGLATDPAMPSGLRYAVPSCWGPLHLNLDGQSQAERADLIQNLQEQIN